MSSPPKKPLNSYMCYTIAQREACKQNNPTASMIQITKLLAEQWKKLSDEEKKVYQEQANKDKLRYQNQMKNYNPSASPTKKQKIEGPPKKLAKQRKNVPPKRTTKPLENFEEDIREIIKIETKKPQKIKKKGNAPKRPLSAYMFYVSENRTEYMKNHPKAKISEAANALSKLWVSMPKDEKQIYFQKSLQDKKRYEHETKIYAPKTGPKPYSSSDSSEDAPVKKNKVVYTKSYSSGSISGSSNESTSGSSDESTSDTGESASGSSDESTSDSGSASDSSDDSEEAPIKKKAPIKKNAPVKKKTIKKAPVKKSVKKPIPKKTMNENGPVKILSIKKPKTPYMLFVEDNRPSVKNANPSLGFGDLSKLVASKWIELPNDKKKTI